MLVGIIMTSCSSPADSWSCERLHEEIANCDKGIRDTEYLYAEYRYTYEEYRDNMKRWKDAKAYYIKRLQTCKSER